MTPFDLETVYLDDATSSLVILDQTRLPNEVIYLHLTELTEMWEAIYELRVRGAPAIGIAAGYALYLGVKQAQADNFVEFFAKFAAVKTYLASSRPTAVNLFWALEKMEACLLANQEKPLAEIKTALREQAHEIKAEDERTNYAIGEYALGLLRPGDGLLTHCNAGSLATGKYGTATSAMYLGQERGYGFKVFVDETRPLLQGARLTAFELSRAGLDVTLICDNMASAVMQHGRVQAVLVGCDRMAANGDTANKIGTSGVAILAKHYGIPFYVCAPTSSIDLQVPDGGQIPIEERPGEEVTTKWFARRMAPAEGVKVYNPAFDVTEAGLISAVITEFGIARPPFQASLLNIMRCKPGFDHAPVD